MKKIIFATILLLIFYLPVVVPLVHADNPFTKQHKTEQIGSFLPKPAIFSKIFTRIILWQQYLKTKMTGLVRQAENNGSITPILLLILTAFVYGVVHAVGPGHGKAIALSYVMTQKPSYLKGLIFSNFIALFHGVSGIVFVIIVKLIINTTIMGNLDNVTNITQIVSYAVITFIGTAIVCFSIYKIVKKDRVKNSSKQLNPIFAAAVIGCIPCPGVIIIMLFALSMDLLILSIALGIAISLGMAVTVSVVVVLAISGKFALIGINGKRSSRSANFEVVVELFAGIALMVLGFLFLGASIA